MSDTEAALMGMLAMAVIIFVVAALVWARSALARRRRARRNDGDVVLDLTYLEQAVRRTETEGHDNAELQRRNLGERRD